VHRRWDGLQVYSTRGILWAPIVSAATYRPYSCSHTNTHSPTGEWECTNQRQPIPPLLKYIDIGLLFKNSLTILYTAAVSSSYLKYLKWRSHCAHFVSKHDRSSYALHQIIDNNPHMWKPLERYPFNNVYTVTMTLMLLEGQTFIPITHSYAVAHGTRWLEFCTWEHVSWAGAYYYERSRPENWMSGSGAEARGLQKKVWAVSGINFHRSPLRSHSAHMTGIIHTFHSRPRHTVNEDTCLSIMVSIVCLFRTTLSSLRMGRACRYYSRRYYSPWR